MLLVSAAPSVTSKGTFGLQGSVKLRRQRGGQQNQGGHRISQDKTVRRQPAPNALKGYSLEGADHAQNEALTSSRPAQDDTRQGSPQKKRRLERPFQEVADDQRGRLESIHSSLFDEGVHELFSLDSSNELTG